MAFLRPLKVGLESPRTGLDSPIIKKQRKYQMKRIPRPQGITQLLHYYSKDNNLHANVIEAYVRQYVQNGYTINLQYYSIYEVSCILKVREEVVQMYINKYLKMAAGYRGWEEDFRLASDIKFQALKKSLEAIHKASEQLSLLQSSQGDGYKPFISSEVNKAIKVYIDSTKNAADIASTFEPKQATISILNQGQIGTLNTLILTPEMAQKAIESQLKTSNFQLGSEAHLSLISASNPSNPSNLGLNPSKSDEGLDRTQQGLGKDLGSEIDFLELPEIVATKEIEREIEAQTRKKKASNDEDLSIEEVRAIKSKLQSFALEDTI